MKNELKTVHSRLKELRISNGYSVKEVASAIGCDVDSIYKYEKDTKPYMERMKEIAKFYNVSVNYLLNGESQDNPISEIPEWGKQLMEQINKMMTRQEEIQTLVNKILPKFSGSQKTDNVFQMYVDRVA